MRRILFNLRIVLLVFLLQHMATGSLSALNLSEAAMSRLEKYTEETSKSSFAAFELAVAGVPGEKAIELGAYFDDADSTATLELSREVLSSEDSSFSQKTVASVLLAASENSSAFSILREHGVPASAFSFRYHRGRLLESLWTLAVAKSPPLWEVRSDLIAQYGYAIHAELEAADADEMKALLASANPSDLGASGLTFNDYRWLLAVYTNSRIDSALLDAAWNGDSADRMRPFLNRLAADSDSSEFRTWMVTKLVACRDTFPLSKQDELTIQDSFCFLEAKTHTAEVSAFIDETLRRRPGNYYSQFHRLMYILRNGSATDTMRLEEIGRIRATLERQIQILDESAKEFPRRYSKVDD
jgi:hypothetical protein